MGPRGPLLRAVLGKFKGLMLGRGFVTFLALPLRAPAWGGCKRPIVLDYGKQASRRKRRKVLGMHILS